MGSLYTTNAFTQFTLHDCNLLPSFIATRKNTKYNLTPQIIHVHKQFKCICHPNQFQVLKIILEQRAQQKGHEIISALYTAYSRTVAFVKSFMVKINWGRKAKCSSTIACYGIIKRAKNLFVSSSCGIFEILMWIFESESNACNRSVSLYFNCDCIVLWMHVLWTAQCTLQISTENKPKIHTLNYKWWLRFKCQLLLIHTCDILLLIRFEIR